MIKASASWDAYFWRGGGGKRNNFSPSEGFWMCASAEEFAENRFAARTAPRCLRPMGATAPRLLAVLCGLAASGEPLISSLNRIFVFHAAWFQKGGHSGSFTETFLMLLRCVYVIVKLYFFVFFIQHVEPSAADRQSRFRFEEETGSWSLRGN